MQHIDAYFRTENDAESAKASLETLKIEEVYLEEVTGAYRNKLMEVIKEAFTAPEQNDHNPYLLHAEIKEEDYPAAVDIVESVQGYISKNE